MKNLYLIAIFTFTILSAQSQNININHEQFPGACNGEAFLDEGSINAQDGYTWWETDSLNNLTNSIASNPTDSIFSLCAGYYALNYNDSMYYYFQIDSIPCSGIFVNLTSTNESSLNSCDANVTSNVGGFTGNLTYDWSSGQNTPNLSGVCAGSYTLIVSDDANCSDTAMTVVQTDSSAGLTAVVQVTDESVDGLCDGSVVIYPNGGAAPYFIEHSDGFMGAADSARCAGLYDAWISDNNGDTIMVSYVVASPSTIYIDESYTDSTIVDTLVSQPTEACTIDFSTIDSAWVSNVVYIASDSVAVTWSIVDDNGTNTVNTVYHVPGGNFEVYAFELSIFCSQKSNTNIFKFRVNHYMEALSTSSHEEIGEDLLIYPNPANENIYIDNPDKTRRSFSIIDSKGSIIYTGELKISTTIVDVSILNTGLYFLQVQGYKPVRFLKK